MARSVLVTGADQGIGLATVVHLARLGFEVTGSVRSDDRAFDLAKVATEAGVDVEPVVLESDDADHPRLLACEDGSRCSAPHDVQAPPEPFLETDPADVLVPCAPRGAGSAWTSRAT